MLIEISSKIIEKLKADAKRSVRKRVNYNFHSRMEDPVNRMLHAMDPGTYVQPHKHESPDKREVFLILEGRVAVFEFDDKGQVLKYIILDRQTGNYGVEVPVGTWHSLVALEPGTVIYEVKDGPYSPEDDKCFAAWAPGEQDVEERRMLFVQSLLSKL